MKKRLVRLVVAVLVFTMAVPFAAFASVEEVTHDTTASGTSLAGIYPAYDDIEFQYSLTEEAEHEVVIPTDLDEEALKEAVEKHNDGSAPISLSLVRDKERGYLDPSLYPYAKDGGKIEEWLDKENTQVIQLKEVKADGKNLVVKLFTQGTEFYYTGDPDASADVKKVYSIDHLWSVEQPAEWLDKCGYFNLTATVGEKDAGTVHAKVVPYDKFRTPYELYDEIEALKSYNGDRYVEVGSLGHTSIDQYDLPYVIVSSDQKAVSDWLAYTEASENNPDQVLKDIEAGKYADMKVPLYVSNCHTNENSAVNGIMEMIQVLINKDEISLNTLEGYTDAGRAKLESEKANYGTSLSKIYGEWATELGRLRGENGDVRDDTGYYGYSSVVDFEKYYKTGKDEFTIDELLEDVFFVLVPTMNMEGYVQATRVTGLGFDPNRDYANQVMHENANAMAFMAKWNPMVYTEIHGRVEGMLVEPCGAPHNPNLEYDLIGEKFTKLGEALGNAAIANNEKFHSYELPARDYIENDPNSPTGVQWGSPWDDLSTNFGAQFPGFYGTCGVTWEMPAYDDITTEQVIPNGLLGQGRFVQANKTELLASQAELFARGVANANTNDKVAKYFVNQYDEPYKQADIMRPVNDGKDENGNFYPECFIIPMDKANQDNLQDAAEAVKWIARNDMKYKIAKKAFTYDGVEYPEGTIIASMYQAKRSLLNANYGPGTFVTVWKGLYSEAFSQHPYARGFDIITVTEPKAYKSIDVVCEDGPDYQGTLAYLADYATQFSGVEGADVVISNASEDTAAAVNELLNAGKKVAMITEGDKMGDFICSYDDFMTIANKYVLSAEGVYGKGFKAGVITKAPQVYVTGMCAPVAGGNVELKGEKNYCFDIYALDQMGFAITNTADSADAVVGTFFGETSEDGNAKNAVAAGKPYMVWGSGAGLEGLVDGISIRELDNGTDALVNVEYPNTTLVNANYVNDKDDLLYEYGTYSFASLPEKAVPIVKNAGKTPMVGCIGIFNADNEAEFNNFNTSVVAFEYKENGMDIVSFANALTHKGHPQDDFKYIANFLFSRSIGDAEYEGVEAPSGTPDDKPGTDKPGDKPNGQKPDSGKPGKAPGTGDDANILLWVVIAVIGAGAAGTIVAVRRRKSVK